MEQGTLGLFCLVSELLNQVKDLNYQGVQKQLCMLPSFLLVYQVIEI